MKLALSFFSLTLLGSAALPAQQNTPAPGGQVVQWTTSVKKINEKNYELHLKATVQGNWHLYSQSTPDGGPLPTELSFVKNPLVILEGLAMEKGDLVKKHEEVFGVDVKYYNGSMELVQKISLKAKIRTNISGTVKYMVCNDRECLPPKTVPFQVAIQ